MPNTSGAPLEADTLPDNAPDLDCFRKAQSGDRAAYGRIVMTYQDRLYNALLRLVGNPDEARDLTQETFTRGLTKIDTFRGQSSPYTWLFRIGMNLALTQLRKTSRHRSFSLDPHNGDGLPSIDGQAATLMHRFASARESSPPQQLERRERQQQVLTALGRLDPDQRALLVMRDIDGFDYQQIATVLDLPLGTLKSRLFRARVALKDELTSYLTDPT